MNEALVWVRACAMWCVVALSAGCTSGDGLGDGERAARSLLSMLEAERRSTPKEDVVARVGERGVVTRAAFEREWSLYPTLSREEVLEVLVRRELLLEELRTEDRMKSRDLRLHLALAAKRGMVDELIREEIHETSTIPEDVPLDALVQQELDKATSPVGYEASHLLVRVDKDAPEPTWARAERAAQAIKQDILSDGADPSLALLQGHVIERGDRDGFELVVNGHLKFPMAQANREELEGGFIPVVEPFALGAAKIYGGGGEGAFGGPVRSPFGVHLILVHERFEPSSPPREEVADALKQKIRRDITQRRLLERMKSLYSDYTWSTDPAALEDDLATIGTPPTSSTQGATQ